MVVVLDSTQSPALVFGKPGATVRALMGKGSPGNLPEMNTVQPWEAYSHHKNPLQSPSSVVQVC